MVGVCLTDGFIEDVIVVPLRRAARAGGFVQKVVSRNVAFSREVFRNERPEFRRLFAVRFAELGARIEVRARSVAAVVAAVLRAHRPVHVEDEIEPVLLAHLKGEVQPLEGVFPQGEFVRVEQLALVGEVMVDVHVGEGHSDDIEPEFLHGLEVLLRDPALLIGGDERLRLFLAEAGVEGHVRGEGVRLLGGAHPSLLHQPSAEVGAAQDDGVPVCVDDVLSHGREHGKSGVGRLVVAGGKADESGDEDGGKRRESEEFFHKADLLKKV